jgi:uncharacterized protein (TIGR02118 family)
MYVSLAFLYRNPRFTQEEFINYWENVHAPLCRRLLSPLNLRRYVAKFPVESDASYAGANYHAVVELGFDTKEALEKALASPEFNQEERKKSSATAFDLPRVTDLVGRESDALI